eukprot:353822-Chlamydomonas_euryale.AAC.5
MALQLCTASNKGTLQGTACGADGLRRKLRVGGGGGVRVGVGEVLRHKQLSVCQSIRRSHPAYTHFHGCKVKKNEGYKGTGLRKKGRKGQQVGRKIMPESKRTAARRSPSQQPQSAAPDGQDGWIMISSTRRP